MVTKKLLASMGAQGMPPDFVLCIGDDKSDEDMFESIVDATVAPSVEIFVQWEENQVKPSIISKI